MLSFFYFYEFEWISIITIIMTFGLLKLICWGCESKYLRLILALIFIFLSSYFINYTIKQPKTLIVKYINKNVDENEINISKEQIINDIMNGKITQNKNNENIKVSKDQIINDIVNDKIENNNENLQVYKQAFQITYDEYNLLKPHEVEYKNQSEYGNVKIIE